MFSMSVANGIEFYEKKKIEGFKDCEGSIEFIFDAVNRKFPAEVITNSSRDLEVFYNMLCTVFVL